jgi:hypothetical protein
LAFIVLAAIGGWRQQPFFYPESSSASDSQPSLAVAAAVLPFVDLLVPDRLNAVDPDTPALTPQPLSRISTGKEDLFVAQFAAPSNHLGNADGKSLAQSFAQELGQAGLFRKVNYIDNRGPSPEELQDVGFLIRGKVLEASLQAGDGVEEYRLSVEISALRPAAGELPEHRFWHSTFSSAKLAQGGSELNEIGDLVREVNQKAIAKLKDKVQSEMDSPSLRENHDDSGDQSAPLAAGSADAQSSDASPAQ